jgi:multidrug efflux pump subunit AcrA (membrane-fusion protein)
MSSYKLIIGLILIVIVLGLSLTAVYFLQNGFVVQAVTPDYSTAQSLVTATGEVRLISEAKITAPSSGIIERVLISAGDLVEEGQDLLIYAVDNWQAELSQRRLELKILQDNLAQLDRQNQENLRRINTEITQKEAQLAAARLQEREMEQTLVVQENNLRKNLADQQLAVAEQEQEVKRLRTLFEAGAVSKRDYDKALERLELLKVDLSWAEEELTRFREETVPLKRLSMQAQLTQIQLALQETRQNLQSLANPEDQKRLDRERIALLQKEASSLEQLIGQAHVKAPSAGRVLDIKVAGGDQVTKGSLLMEIGDINKPQIVLFVPAESFHLLAVDAVVHLNFEKRSPIMGKVSRIAHQAENGMVEIAVNVEAWEITLLPGTKVSGEIEVTRPDILLLPPQAVVARKIPKTSPILRTGEDTVYYVFAVDRKTRKVTPRRVQIGETGNGFIEVLSGIGQNNDIVVGDEAALARLRSQLEQWERKNVKEIRATFAPEG